MLILLSHVAPKHSHCIPFTQALWDSLELVKANDEAVLEMGTKYLSDVCKKMFESGLGINGLHIYTMNQASPHTYLFRLF